MSGLNVGENKQKYLRACLKKSGTEVHRGSQKLNHAFVLLANGYTVDRTYFAHTFDEIRYRLDCTDFRLITIQRMLFLYGHMLDAELVAEIEELLPDYDYWISENTRFPGVKNFWTENHIMLHSVNELLAAQRYPDRFFRSRGMRGGAVIPLAEEFIFHWIDVKIRVGFCEWDSNTYMDCNIASLAALIDFAENPRLVREARRLMDLIALNFAINSFRGYYCGSHGRGYTDEIKDSRHESVRPVLKMMWDEGDYGNLYLHFGALAFATTGYEQPEFINKIYFDRENTIEGFESQSYNVEDAHMFGRAYESEPDIAFTWPNMGYTHRLIIDRQIAFGEKYHIAVHDETYKEHRYYKLCAAAGVEGEPCRCTTYMPRVNKALYKTGDYHLSCAQDYRKGEFAFQQHIWQATLSPTAVVFSSQPSEIFPLGARDHVGVNHTFPRALQYKNVVFSFHRIDMDHTQPYSMLYFPKPAFDQVMERERWIFGRVGDGYLACLSQNGFAPSGRYGFADKELLCHEPENMYLCVAGNRKEDGSFEEFTERILSSDLAFRDDFSVSFTCGGIHYEAGWDTEFRVNGRPVSLKDYRRMDNPYCRSEYGSGRYEISLDGETFEI